MTKTLRDDETTTTVHKKEVSNNATDRIPDLPSPKMCDHWRDATREVAAALNRQLADRVARVVGGVDDACATPAHGSATPTVMQMARRARHEDTRPGLEPNTRSRPKTAALLQTTSTVHPVDAVAAPHFPPQRQLRRGHVPAEPLRFAAAGGGLLLPHARPVAADEKSRHGHWDKAPPLHGPSLPTFCQTSRLQPGTYPMPTLMPRNTVQPLAMSNTQACFCSHARGQHVINCIARAEFNSCWLHNRTPTHLSITRNKLRCRTRGFSA